MNHRCRLDWLFYFMVLMRNGRLDHEKIILRDDLRLIPGAGEFDIGIFIVKHAFFLCPEINTVMYSSLKQT